MPVQILEKPQKTRCYKCGDDTILYICHHCGRAMCKHHGITTDYNTRHQRNTEFTGLGLQNNKCKEIPCHCEFCDHITLAPSYVPFIIGTVVMLVGLLLLFQKDINESIGSIYGAAAVTLGVFSHVLGYTFFMKRKKKARDLRPMPPLFPRYDSLSIREHWHSHITLGNDGRYTSKTSSLGGYLEVPLRFSKSDRDRLKNYCQKYNLEDTKNLEFHSGFITFSGPIGFKLDHVEGVHQFNGVVIPLKRHINQQPYLDGASDKKSSEWLFQKKYTLLKTPDPDTMPIRLVPVLIQKKGQRLLELEIQWDEETFNRNPLDSNLQKQGTAFNRIELLELLVPIHWGEVEELIYQGLVGEKTLNDGKKVVRSIVWEKPPIKQEELTNRYCRFYVRFENKIDLSDSIGGRIEMSFSKSLSMVEGINVYYPVGTKNDEIVTDIETKIVADFDLSLAGLRYQDVRLLPNPMEEEDRDKMECMEFKDVVPNHTTVVALSNAIADADFYMQRVVEDPPRAGKKANILNRYWDVAGRYYRGVYPIDFHLTISGEEITGSGTEVRRGTTKTMLSVQGTYTNQEMKQLIEAVWEQLAFIIKNTCQQLAKTTQSRTTEEPSGTYTDEIDDHMPTRESVIEDRIIQFGRLFNHLDDFREAFTAARVFENTYLEIKARIEKEWQTLKDCFEALRNI